MRVILLLCICAVAVGSPLGCPFSASKNPSTNDLTRASQAQPRPDYLENTKSISAKLNQHLALDLKLKTAPCDSFTMDELKALQRALHCQLSTELNGVYKAKPDRRALRFDSLDAFEGHWKAQEEEIEKDASAHGTLRAARCAEVVQWYVHHLTEEGRSAFKDKAAVLPQMAPFDMSVSASNASAATKAAYSTSYTCVSGHNNNETNALNGTGSYPYWPEEVTYNATGFGPYPFWLGPVSADISQGVGIQVSWSRTKKAEKFEHASCAMSNAGYSSDGVPCVHLMLQGAAYFYTAAEDFCCISGTAPVCTNKCDDTGLCGSPAGQTCSALVQKYSCADYYAPGKAYAGWCDKECGYGACAKSEAPKPAAASRKLLQPGGQSQVLTAVQYDWMKDMTLQGTTDGYEGTYYSGKVKNYTMDCSGGCGPGNFYIWYLTDMNDKPIEQGEGCQVMPRTSSCTTGGSYLFHQYNPATWKETTLDASVFAVPDVCQKTTTQCEYP